MTGATIMFLSSGDDISDLVKRKPVAEMMRGLVSLVWFVNCPEGKDRFLGEYSYISVIFLKCRWGKGRATTVLSLM